MFQNKGWTELLEELALQRQCLDMLNGTWIGEYSSHGGVIHCTRGCNNCCALTVNCTLTEAVALAGVLDKAQLAAVNAYATKLQGLMDTVTDIKGYLQLQSRVMGMCPLLTGDGSCGVYGTRPLACRALLSTKECYWCGIDFTTLPVSEKEEYIASLDRSVTAFPLHYVASAQDTGREFESRQLALMQKLFGFSCYGCMPILVSLVCQHALAEAVSREEAQHLIEATGFASPLLVSLLP